MRDDKQIHEHDISSRGNIYMMLSAAIGAYNRRTDALVRIAQADPTALKDLADKLKASTDELEAAIKSQANKGD